MRCPQGAGRSIAAFPERLSKPRRRVASINSGFQDAEFKRLEDTCCRSCKKELWQLWPLNAPLKAASGSGPRVLPQLEYITRESWPGRRQTGKVITHWEVLLELASEVIGCVLRQCFLHLDHIFLISSNVLSIGSVFYVNYMVIFSHVIFFAYYCTRIPFLKGEASHHCSIFWGNKNTMDSESWNNSKEKQ